MSLLEVKNLMMDYPDKILYQDAGFNLEKSEHVGLIGQNGSGKSTLIDIITGKTLPLKGQIIWQNDIKIGYLDQYAQINKQKTLIEFLHSAFEELYAKENLINEYYELYANNLDDKLLEKISYLQEQLEKQDFYDIDTKINKVIDGLNLSEIGINKKIKDMSGGQREKIILAKLLLQNNDILILDEPTNYLDTKHINWLIEYINNFNGSVLIASHDYVFLEQVTNTILDISFQKVTKYRGGFKKAMLQKENKQKQDLKRFTKQQNIIDKNETFISKNKAGTKSKQAKSREKMLDKLETVTLPKYYTNSTFKFIYQKIDEEFFDDTDSDEIPPVLEVNNLSVGYNNNSLFNKIDFKLYPGQKMAITGFNGVGKSTLIKTILGKTPKISGEIYLSKYTSLNYFEQELTWIDNNKSAFKIIQDNFEKLNKENIFKILSSVGLNKEKIDAPIKTLSGGEQTKVKIANMELLSSNFLIMDEPTNHLDKKSKEALKRALKAFPGSLILITHEKKFFEDWIDLTIDVSKLKDIK